jgi:hypothetical protein
MKCEMKLAVCSAACSTGCVDGAKQSNAMQYNARPCLAVDRREKRRTTAKQTITTTIKSYIILNVHTHIHIHNHTYYLKNEK